ncbi:MAG: S49 family peptidase [Pseudomonadota bacterium]
MPDVSVPRVAAQWLGQPLMLHGDKAAAMAIGFCERLTGSTVNVLSLGGEDVTAGQLSGRIDRYFDPHETYLEPAAGVALIEVEGVLIHKGAWIGQSSGETSYEALRASVVNVRNDASINAVVFEFDSPGGLVSGAYELAEDIHALSREKPTIAILTDEACSAAYLLASACGSIVIPKVGLAGSIGIIQVYMNMLKRAEKEGVDVTVFSAGEKKADHHPFKEPREGFFEDAQSEAVKLRDMFAETVAAYRSNLTSDAIIAMESGTYRGQEAVDAGLADVVADPVQAMTEFCAMYGTPS